MAAGFRVFLSIAGAALGSLAGSSHPAGALIIVGLPFVSPFICSEIVAALLMVGNGLVTTEYALGPDFEGQMTTS